jgi:hypothetical protein
MVSFAFLGGSPVWVNTVCVCACMCVCVFQPAPFTPLLEGKEEVAWARQGCVCVSQWTLIFLPTALLFAQRSSQGLNHRAGSLRMES